MLILRKIQKQLNLMRGLTGHRIGGTNENYQKHTKCLS